jgi:peptidoglycan/xylan/chitin deacetylase (PgdA/CDA1 family)/glycosyltransferase involved in cell wall biosynthesis
LNSPGYQVVCVCGGYGFPLGSASSARIVMIGKTLQSAGIRFHVLHCGPSPVTLNTQTSGVYEGITFEYTTALKRPANRLLRLLVYVRGVAGLTLRLVQMWPQRRRTLVHLYVMMGPLNLYTGWLCRLLRLPVLQELCEWWPGVNLCTGFTRWLHKRSMFQRATGVLVISREIERRAAMKVEEVNDNLLVYRLPAIVDFQRFAAVPAVPDPLMFAYCGTWLNDICFIVKALGQVQSAGYAAKLTIIGGTPEHLDKILACADKNGVSRDDLLFTGSVDEASLAATYRSATALLLPMRDDDQSRTRMPNKLAEYLASGRPVVAGGIGEVTEFLSDGVSAYLAQPGSEEDFARNMIAVLADPDRARCIGAAGQEACRKYLDFTEHASGLAWFVGQCIEQYKSPQEKRSMTRVYLSFRNLFCGLVALFLITAGYVRRARKQTMNSNVITPIYFHNPNPRLFRRCIEWLLRHGYTFVSERDVIEIIQGRKTAPPRAVWLSFDDGFKEFLDNVVPLVREHGIPVTLFVPTGIVQGEGMFYWLRHKRRRDALSIEELKQIAAYPEITVGSHTVTHAITSHLSEAELQFELSESKRTLERWIDAETISFAYPVGQFNGNERAVLARCGYTLAVTTENALITSQTDPYLVPRFSIGDNISFLEAICNMVGVWRPAIDPLVRLFQQWGAVSDPMWRASGTDVVRTRPQSSHIPS